MNIFEDLVIELKQENLLEETFIDAPQGEPIEESADDEILSSDEIHMPNDLDVDPDTTHAGTEWTSSEPDEPIIRKNAATPTTGQGTAESADLKLLGNDEVVETAKPASDREFFKKRAASEMTSMKMVDAVLSAIEREHLKVVPQIYDDLEAKKALHTFLQVADNDTSEEHKAAEFRLLNETELWCSALADRDRNILVGHLRVYCETCKPKLSSVAMLALARFYRNLPYSDMVRAKFDFIMTRLFTKAQGDEKREPIFEQDRTLAHVKTLYADWSSIPIYSVDDDDAEILLAALGFEDFAAEADTARSFDELIKGDFFKRLRLFKESIAEMYFAPVVIATAIGCNVRIGNRYVELIELEREKMNVDQIHERFAELDDLGVSEVAGRSLGLADMIRAKGQDPTAEEPSAAEPEQKGATVHRTDPERTNFYSTETVAAVDTPSSRLRARVMENVRSVNRYFLAASFLLVALSVGIYVWANYFVDPGLPATGVKTLSFQGTEIGEHVRTAKLSGDTLYLVAQPTFASLGKAKQTDLLQQFLKAGSDKGWSKVNIMNASGQTIGFASPTRSEIYQQ